MIFHKTRFRKCVPLFSDKLNRTILVHSLAAITSSPAFIIIANWFLYAFALKSQHISTNTPEILLFLHFTMTILVSEKTCRANHIFKRESSNIFRVDAQICAWTENLNATGGEPCCRFVVLTTMCTDSFDLLIDSSLRYYMRSIYCQSVYAFVHMN